MLRRLISRFAAPRMLAAVLFSSLVLPYSVGCYEKEDAPLGRSWFDPTELGRYPENTLVVPIVKNLDAVAEGPDKTFVNARDVTSDDLVYTAVDSVIVPNDIIQVTITGLFGPGIESVRPAQKVSSSGKISLPYINQVKVAGLTEAQAEEAIRAAYRDSGMMADAPVTVTTLQSQGQTFSINGAVARPGRYLIETEDFRIMNALVVSGNVTSELGIDYIYVIRNKSSNPSPAQPAPNAQPAPVPGANDPLSPGSALPSDQQPRRVSYLAQGMPAEPAPSTPAAAEPEAPAEPATSAAPNTEGRTVIIDGKEVPMGEQASEPSKPSEPSEPASEPVKDQPAEPGTFEFQAPQEPSDREVIRIPNEALKRGELKYNIVIRPGDFVFVPSPVIGEYYMGGHVNRPGAYSLTARTIRLTDAVLAAGGLDPVAWPDRCSIRRKISGDRAIIVRVNLQRVVDGLDPDIYLRPDDQVMVGTNAIAPFLAVFRNAFRMTYGFGLIYDKNFADDNNN